MKNGIGIDIDIMNQLMPNVLTVVSQLLASCVLFFLMYKLAYKPVKKILDARSDYEQQKLSKADELCRQNEEITQNSQAIIDEANQKARKILEEANRQGESMKEKLIDEGHARAQALLDEANNNVESQKARLREEAHDEMVEIAFSAAEKMVEQKLDAKADRQSISDFIKEIEKK